MNTSNFINILGHLGDDPKVITLNSGVLLTELNVATNEYYKDKDGNRQSRTEWHTVKAFGKLAEIFERHFTKGQQISVVGSMRYRKWVDKHEQNRRSAEIIADSFSFVGSGNRRDDRQDYSAGMVAEPPAPKTVSRRSQTAAEPFQPTDEPVLAEADGDLPF